VKKIFLIGYCLTKFKIMKKLILLLVGFCSTFPLWAGIEENEALLQECLKQEPSLEIIKELVEKGADVNCTGIIYFLQENSCKPIVIESQNQSNHKEELSITENQKEVTPLYLVFDYSDNLEVAEYLINQKADIMKAERLACYGGLLMEALMHQIWPRFYFLLDHGVRPDLYTLLFAIANNQDQVTYLNGYYNPESPVKTLMSRVMAYYTDRQISEALLMRKVIEDAND